MSTQRTKDSDRPHRDAERLREIWEDHDSVASLARELDLCHATTSKWLQRHGIREREENSLANKLRYGNIDESDIEEDLDL